MRLDEVSVGVVIAQSDERARDVLEDIDQDVPSHGPVS
jgi:hypothetical protein